MEPDVSEPLEPDQVFTAEPAPNGEGPLEPDAVFLAGEGQEGRGVNADDAYPALRSVNARGLLRRYLRSAGRTGTPHQTSKHHEERHPRQ